MFQPLVGADAFFSLGTLEEVGSGMPIQSPKPTPEILSYFFRFRGPIVGGHLNFPRLIRNSVPLWKFVHLGKKKCGLFHNSEKFNNK